MVARDYNQLLYEKAYSEYETFINDLKAMTPEQILEHAYEKTIKEDILSLFESVDLAPKAAKALYLRKHPLDEVYQKWLDTDVSYMDMLRDSMEDKAKEAVKEMNAKKRESR